MKLNIALALGAFYVGISAWMVAEFDARKAREYRAEGIDQLDVCFQDNWFAQAASARAGEMGGAVGRWVSWAYGLPPHLSVQMAALASGVLGSVVGMMRSQRKGKRLEAAPTVGRAFLGGAAGLVSFAVVLLGSKVLAFHPDQIPSLMPLVLGLAVGMAVQRCCAQLGGGFAVDSEGPLGKPTDNAVSRANY